MMPLLRAVSMLTVAVVGTLAAQDEATVTLPLRVVSVAADGKVVIDRGSRDLLREGDVLELLPPDGQRLRGRVIAVDERSALVELALRAAAPAPGTKGEVSIPKARAPARPQPAPRQPADTRPPATPPPTEPGQQPDPQQPPSQWPTRDDGWKPGMPLLSAVEPLRPEQRTPTLRGSMFAVAGMTGSTIGDGFDPFLRLGTEFDADNPIGHGGSLHFDTEFDYRTEQNDLAGANLVLRRLSYSIGGTRFDRDRWEFGRFLHSTLPDLGVLDGTEWTRRLGDGSHVGVSIGWLPVPDDEFGSFTDFQVSAFYEWLADASGTTRVGAALQKTWHYTTSDRDAIVLTLHQSPIDGWQVHGNAWIDFYFGNDNIKGRGVELTAGSLSLSRSFGDGGVDLSWRRTRYPDIRRHEFPLLPPNQLVDERNDRLVVDTWQLLSADGDRAHATLMGFDDDERLGGSAEFGVQLHDWFGKGTTTDLTGFGGRAQFERFVGGRASWSRFTSSGHLQLLYEITWHRLDDRPPDGDDLIQHRLGLSLDHRADNGWVIGASADAIYWDQELGWSMTVTVHRNF